MIHTTTHTRSSHLKGIPVIRPNKAGEDWKGISHKEFWDSLNQAIQRQGWTPGKDPVLLLTQNGGYLTGCLSVQVSQVILPPGFQPMVGFVNSNTRATAVRLYCGAYHERATVGYVHSKIRLNRHTTHFDLSGNLDYFLSGILWDWADASLLLSRWASLSISRDQVSEVLARASQETIVAGNQKAVLLPIRMGKSLLWANPFQGGGTAWDLYESVARYLRDTPPFLQLERLLGFGIVLENFLEEI